jgi:hypothetical protein
MVGKTPRPGPFESDENRRRRLVENERIHRRLNRRIEELNRVALMVDEPPGGDQAAFLCECSLTECRERIALDVGTYSRIHRRPERFVVVPGHETAEIEEVLVRRTDYLVVAKG